MAIHTRFRVAAALGALVAPLAFVAATQTAADAASSRTHDISMYKKEMYLPLEGEFPDNVASPSMSCDNGDIVTDGMWRIDSVDDYWDDGDFSAGDPLKVKILASYPDAGDRRTWNFRIQNDNDGRAQLKLFITCIRGTVDFQNGHSHGLDVTGVGLKSTTQNAPFGFDWTTNTCPTGYVPIAPGFNFTNGSGALFRSKPWGSIGWSWGFNVAGPVDVNLYLSCLNLKVLPSGTGHSHKLTAGQYTSVRFIPDSKKWEETYSCDGSYKALVGQFDISGWNNVWFLGMDPRIKSRSYSFMRSGGPADVTIGALCVKSRTGKQIAP